MKCEYCGQHSHDNNLVCNYCGAPLPVKYTADKKIIFKYIPPHCTGCGRQLSETEVFCEECQTISSAVTQTLADNPNKSCDDFVRRVHQYHGEYYTDCPHCGITYEDKAAQFSLPIYSPIVICENCHLAYLRPEKDEWSVVSLTEKLISLLLRNDRWMIVCLFICIIIFTMCQNFERSFAIGLWGIPIAAFFFYVAHLFLDQKKIQLSKKRLEQNPDYPQILADMGYGKYMSKKYHNLLKDKPMTLKEVLKEAITFD